MSTISKSYRILNICPSIRFRSKKKAKQPNVSMAVDYKKILLWLFHYSIFSETISQPANIWSAILHFYVAQFFEREKSVAKRVIKTEVYETQEV